MRERAAQVQRQLTDLYAETRAAFGPNAQVEFEAHWQDFMDSLFKSASVTPIEEMYEQMVRDV